MAVGAAAPTNYLNSFILTNSINPNMFIDAPIRVPRSPGLRKFIPQPDRYAERYGHFTLTARDIEILETIYSYRHLEARHVRALVGGSGQQITRRLQGLFHKGYLGRYARRERMRLDLDPGAPMIAYGLEVKGARALERNRAAAAAATGAEPEPICWKKDYTRRTEWFLEHNLMTSDFRCNLELALRETPDTELVTWDQGQGTWFRVTIPEKGKRVARVAPDAYFVLRQNGQLRYFFLEIDRSTEEHRRLVERFTGYWWYLQDPSFTKPRGGRPRVNVLFVTTGVRRMRNMMETLRRMQKPNRADHGGKGLFWFRSCTSFSCDNPLSVLKAGWSTVATAQRDVTTWATSGAPRPASSSPSRESNKERRTTWQGRSERVDDQRYFLDQ
jgi:hypothetical protein